MISIPDRARTLVALLAVGTASACNYDPENRAPFSRAESEQMLAAATVRDIEPPGRIAISGRVLLVGFAGEAEPVDWNDRDESGNIRNYRPSCHALCAALLATPGVTSVTIEGEAAEDNTRPSAWTFRIVPKNQCPKESVRPKEPDRLDIDRPPAQPLPTPKTPADAKMRDRIAMARTAESLETAWTVRLATTDCIRADAVRPPPDFTIRQTNAALTEGWREPDDACESRDPLPVYLERLELLDRSGTILLRRSHAQTLAVTVPLRRGFCGNSTWMTPGIGFSRERIETGKPVRAHNAVARSTNLQTTMDGAKARAAVGETLRKALANHRLPKSDPAFDLSETYLRLLAAGQITPDDRKTLVDMIKDERVVKFGGIYAVVDQLGSESGILRAPIIERAGRPNADRDAVRGLSDQLTSIPAARMGDAEWAILRDPDRRSRARGLIEAGSESGEITNWVLAEMLAEHSARIGDAQIGKAHSQSRSDELEAIHTIRRALCLRGRQASEVLPKLLDLQSTNKVPSYIVDTEEWQIMLARLGQPIEAIKPPAGQNPEQYSKRMRVKLDPSVNEGSHDPCR